MHLLLWLVYLLVQVHHYFKICSRIIKTYFLDYAGQNIEKKTSESVFDKIMRYDLLRAPKSNGSVAALVKDFETFQQFFTSVTILLLIDIPFMFLFLYVIYAIGGSIVLVPY